MQLGWIDFSEKDRKKAIDVIHLLEEKGTRDEIGIGIIRDAFSNMFFPGTSTVQTRAKYFYIIPYIIKECCENKKNKTIDDIKRMIDVKEKEYAISLKENGITDGVIGADVIPDKWVVRKPYSIYWNGIKTFGIFTRENMSLNEYIHYMLRHRNEEKISNWTEEGEENEQDDKMAGKTGLKPFWNLPEDYYVGKNNSTQIELSKKESNHLRKCITSLDKEDCLLKYIVENNIQLKQYTITDEPFRLLYTELIKRDDLSPQIKNYMQIALKFDSLVYLSMILYNKILSDDKNEVANNEWELYYKQRLPEIDSLDLDEMFYLTNVKDIGTKKFLSSMQSFLISGDISNAKKTVYDREIKLKGKERSKLANRTSITNDKWIGIKHLDFRMRVTGRLINDLYNAE